MRQKDNIMRFSSIINRTGYGHSFGSIRKIKLKYKNKCFQFFLKKITLLNCLRFSKSHDRYKCIEK